MRKYSIIFFASLVTFGCSANYGEHETAMELVDELVEDMEFDRETLESVMASAKKVPEIIKLMTRPAESISWYRYKDIFLQPERVAAGVEFIKKFESDLQRAEETYDVPPHVIAAIIGVETYYGDVMGRHRVLDALATLGFDYPPRQEFFRDELRHFLILACEERIKPFDQDDSCARSDENLASGDGRNILDLKGSYAGAMGFGQFIPSSYRNFAIDFDNDGIRDIWSNETDAIGSVANYFAVHGWKNGETILEFVAVDSENEEMAELVNDGLKPTKTVAEWEELGVESEAPETAMAALFAYRLDDDEESGNKDYILGFDNFYVITRYNRSRLYARVVYQLAQDIAEKL